jgi:hypothetical protein
MDNHSQIVVSLLYNLNVDIPSSTYPAIGSITAALIGGGIAFLSSVLAKEQKTSEFRQAWINSVLEDIAEFIGAVESLTGSLSSQFAINGREAALSYLSSAEPQVRTLLGAYYRVRLRLNPSEHQNLLSVLERLQRLLLKGEIPDPAQVDGIVRNIEQIGHDALKAEWNRVKRGERPFYVTKNISLGIFFVALLVLILLGSQVIAIKM